MANIAALSQKFGVISNKRTIKKISLIEKGGGTGPVKP
jgi:hypothetical protein